MINKWYDVHKWFHDVSCLESASGWSWTLSAGWWRDTWAWPFSSQCLLVWEARLTTWEQRLRTCLTKPNWQTCFRFACRLAVTLPEDRKNLEEHRRTCSIRIARVIRKTEIQNSVGILIFGAIWTCLNVDSVDLMSGWHHGSFSNFLRSS